MVKRWIVEFKMGRTSTTDDPRVGQPDVYKRQNMLLLSNIKPYQVHFVVILISLI